MENINGLNNQIERSYQVTSDWRAVRDTKELPKAETNLESTVLESDAIEISANFPKSSKTSVVFGDQNLSTVTSDINFKVVNKETGEVINEFPKRSLLEAVKSEKLNDVLGLLIDLKE